MLFFFFVFFIYLCAWGKIYFWTPGTTYNIQHIIHSNVTIRSSLVLINIYIFCSNQGFFCSLCSYRIKQCLTFSFGCCFSPRILDLEQQTSECFMFIRRLVSVCLKRRCWLYEAGIKGIGNGIARLYFIFYFHHNADARWTCKSVFSRKVGTTKLSSSN